MVPILLVLLLILILFGFGFAIEVLWYIALAVLVLWLLGFFLHARHDRRGRKVPLVPVVAGPQPGKVRF